MTSLPIPSPSSPPVAPRPLAAGDALAVLVEEWAPRFLENLPRTAPTRRNYGLGLRRFARWARGATFAPGSNPVVAFERALAEEGVGAGTRALYLSAIRRFFGVLERERIIDRNPALGVDPIRRNGKTHKRGALAVEEARRVLAAVDRSTLEGRRDYAILTLLLFTGRRGIELARADRADLLVRSGRKVLVYQGKGHAAKDAVAVLPTPVVGALADYLASRGEDGQPALFVGIGNRNRSRLAVDRIRRVVSRYLEAAGVKGAGISPHSLRHSFATFALLAGANVREVKAALDHASIETTEVYAHDADRLRGAAEEA